MPGRGAGGVETVLVALISALGKLDGPDEFVIVSHSEAGDWLTPFLGANSRVVTEPRKISRRPFTARLIRKVLSPLKRSLQSAPIEWSFPAVSGGFLEGLGGDVIHFPWQDFTVCSIPSVYSPHDLQHRHFPQFFDARNLVWREEIYRKGCDFSKAVVVGSQWVKDDIAFQFGVNPAKIQVIPLGPPLTAFESLTPADLSGVQDRYGLNRPFILYPSMTWPHKNHLRLIDAVKRCRSGVDVICTGYKNGYWPTIEAHLKKSGMQSRVRFLGLVPAVDLRALYRLCQSVIIPTLFESTSEPIFEAWEAGKAVACSRVTALPEQTSGAALLFDPLSIDSIAAAIDALGSGSEMFAELGRRRLKDFSWGQTARAYRALYRKCANCELSNDEVDLLQNDWMAKERAA